MKLVRSPWQRFWSCLVHALVVVHGPGGHQRTPRRLQPHKHEWQAQRHGGQRSEYPPRSRLRTLFALIAGLFGTLVFPAVAIAQNITYNNGPSSLLGDPVIYYPGANNAANYTPQVGALFPKYSSSNNVVHFVDGNIYVANPGVAGRTGPAGDVFGGIGDTSPVTRNTVYIHDGRVSNVYGGLAAGSGVNLRDNTVIIDGGTVMNGVYGGRIILGSNVWAERNTVRVNSGEIRGNVYGAYSVVSGTFLQLNNITISGGYIQGTNAIISGAYGFVSGIDVRANSVSISGGTIKDANIYGGRGQSALTNTSTIESNTVTISGGLINENFTDKGVYGGQNITGNGAVVRNNWVTITGGTVNANIYGGYNAGNGPTAGNIVNISGGSITGNIYGGRSSTGTATSNIVTIGGSASLQNPNLYGVYGGWVNSGGGDAFTGNTLNKNSAAAVGAVSNFQFVNFGYSGEANIATLDTTPTGSAQPGVTVNTGANRVNFSGDMIGSGSLIKTGTGTLTMSGVGAFAGGTELVSGTLGIANSQALNVADSTTSKKGYITFTGADKATVAVDSGLALTNSFRTDGSAGDNNYVNLNAGAGITQITGVNINDNGGAFYVASGTALNANVASNLALGFNAAAFAPNIAGGLPNDLYVENNGVFNLNLSNQAQVIFASGIDGGGTLNISGLGAAQLILPMTFQMGTTKIDGSANSGNDATIFTLARVDTGIPRVTFNTNTFTLIGNDSSPIAAVLQGDGIVTADAINVTNGALMPTAVSDSGTLTLDALAINLTDFNLLYRAFGQQNPLSYDGEGIPVSKNSLLNLVTGGGTLNMGQGAVYFVTGNGLPFEQGDYLLIKTDQNLNSAGYVPSASLAAYVDGFLLDPTGSGPRGGFQLLLGGDPNVGNGNYTTGDNSIWFRQQGLNSLTMEWTGDKTKANLSGSWESGPYFYSLQDLGGVHEENFLTGDRVHVFGNTDFNINLPAASLVSKIVVSGLVVGKDTSGSSGSDAYTGHYTFSGEGGITADENSAFGSYLTTLNPDELLVPTGKLEKYGDSTLIFNNTGGNLFKEGIDLYGGIVAFNQADQLGVGTGAAITFKGDATLRAYAGMTLSPAQNIVIEGGKTATFDTQEHALRIDGTISGSNTGDGKLNKLGSGTLTLGGALNSYGASGSYGGDINIAAGTLVFDQSADQTLSGVISGPGAMTKKGANTLTLSAANTFTGPLNIAAGTLLLDTAASLATGTMRLGGGATFDYSAAAASYQFKDLYVDGQNAMIKTNGSGAMFSGANSTLTFNLPSGMDISQPMLWVDDKTTISDSLVKVNNLAGAAANLGVNERITLIDTMGKGLESNHDGIYVGALGIAKAYYLITDDWNLYLGARPNEQVKSLAEGRLAGLAFLDQGELIWGPGMYAAMRETERQEAGFVPFAATSGGSLRYDSGSHVDVGGVHLLTGVAGRASPAVDQSLVAGVFFEAGWGNYDSHNSFHNLPAVKGSGDIDYYGAGILGRYEIQAGAGGVYGEASLRTGRASVDFSSRDILNGVSDRTTYDSASPYVGAHAGVGYAWNIDSRSKLDLSTKYIWLHLNGDSVRVAGDEVKFKAAESHRWRTGGRFSYAVDKRIIAYVGAYFDYEFDGKARATINGDRVDAPDMRGATGQGELGLIVKPAPGMPMSLDLGVQGYVGVRQGVTASLRLNYQF